MSYHPQSQGTLMKIGGPSDQSDRLSTQKLSIKKSTDILRSEIKRKFVTSAMLAFMISSAKS